MGAVRHALHLVQLVENQLLRAGEDVTQRRVKREAQLVLEALMKVPRMCTGRTIRLRSYNDRCRKAARTSCLRHLQTPASIGCSTLAWRREARLCKSCPRVGCRGTRSRKCKNIRRGWTTRQYGGIVAEAFQEYNYQKSVIIVGESRKRQQSIYKTLRVSTDEALAVVGKPQTRTCVKCDKDGHMARNCTKESKV